MRKAVAVIMLIFIFTNLMSCSNNEETLRESTLTYIVKDLSDFISNQTIEKIMTTSNNELVLTNLIGPIEESGQHLYKLKYYHTDSGRKVLTEKELPLLSLNEYSFDSVDCALDSQDNLYIIINYFNEQQCFKKLDVYDLRGNKVKEKHIVFSEDESSHLEHVHHVHDEYCDHVNIFNKVAVDKYGHIYILKNDYIEVFNDDLNLIRTINDKDYILVDIDDNGDIILVSTENQSDLKVELLIEKFSSIEEKAIYSSKLNANMMPNAMHYYQNSIYLVNQKKITRYDLDSEKEEALFDYLDYIAMRSCSQINVDKNGAIYLGGMSYEDKPLLYRFEENSGQKKISKKEIIIQADAVEEHIKVAARKFEKINTDISIKIIENMGKSKEEYEKPIAVELLAGKGPDMLYGDWSYNNYVDKNLLEDLDKYINKENEELYVRNILDVVKINNKQYVFPVSFAFYAMYANEKILKEKGIEIDDNNWTWEDFFRITKEISDNTEGTKYYALRNGDISSVVYNFLQSNINYFLDTDGKIADFNNDYFISILERLKELNSPQVSHPDESTGNFSLALTDRNKMRDVAFVFSYEYSYAPQRFTLNEIFNEGYKMLLLPKSDKGDNLYGFMPRTCAINKNSPYKSEVWEFIKFISSEEINHGEIPLDIFSINKKNNEKLSNYYRTGEFTTPEGEKLVFDIKINPSIIDKTDEIISKLDYNYFYNNDLVYSIYDEVLSCIDGKTSSKEAAKIIQNKIELYLKE